MARKKIQNNKLTQKAYEMNNDSDEVLMCKNWSSYRDGIIDRVANISEASVGLGFESTVNGKHFTFGAGDPVHITDVKMIDGKICYSVVRGANDIFFTNDEAECIDVVEENMPMSFADVATDVFGQTMNGFSNFDEFEKKVRDLGFGDLINDSESFIKEIEATAKIKETFSGVAWVGKY